MLKGTPGKILPMLKLRPKLIISDWDETITLEDTIKLVSEAAYLAKPNFQPPFNHFLQVYKAAYEDFNNKFLVREGRRDTIEKEIKYQIAERQVEQTSIDEMVRRGLFAGITPSQFASQAEKVKLRPGVVKFFEHCERLEIPVVILSINWTSIIIKEALKLNGIRLNNVDIIVNEIAFEDGKSTGEWLPNPNIRTGIDKLNVVKSLSSLHGETWYIGDSSTDLLSVLEANKGIIMKSESILKHLNDLAIKFQPLRSPLDDATSIFVGDWEDITNAL
ncbi:uncharacterized protein PRCAT00004612001 [Priceomyces carsonii]|uniref:uncharacterized protein n=1 Tax=Priceomyces carsonii TaxID=28549 RepID=UPI002ED9913C|nr:unnamed protein product [Priceomyces carsonii]